MWEEVGRCVCVEGWKRDGVRKGVGGEVGCEERRRVMGVREGVKSEKR